MSAVVPHLRPDPKLSRLSWILLIIGWALVIVGAVLVNILSDLRVPSIIWIIGAALQVASAAVTIYSNWGGGRQIVFSIVRAAGGQDREDRIEQSDKYPR